MNTAKLGVAFSAALIGSAMCAAVMSIGVATVPLAEALVIHALGAPILFIFISFFYFQRSASTTPLQTAFIFSLTCALVNFLIMGLLVKGDLTPFASMLGTWMPVVLVFTATHITGLLVLSGQRSRVPAR